MLYNILGSPSSIDNDVAIVVDQLGTIAQNHQTVKAYTLDLEKELPQKSINANLVILKNGVIAACFKGTPDELNNAIYHTYQYHNQKYPLFIEKLVDRNVEWKIARVLRYLLAYISKSKYRLEVKQALKSTIQQQIHLLQKIDISEIALYEGNLKDIYKSLAFQLGQVLALLENIELYTKEKITEKFENLHPFLNRLQTTDLALLERYKNQLVTQIALNHQGLLPKSEMYYEQQFKNRGAY